MSKKVMTMAIQQTVDQTMPVDRNHASQKAHDLAAYIVSSMGPKPVGTLKLQKLMYYCQGWKLAMSGVPFLSDPIEAWKHGPVFPAIYKHRSRQAAVESWDTGHPSNLMGLDREIANAVLRIYGDKTGWALREMTHKEAPWRDAWRRSQQGQTRAEPISVDEIRDYFKALQHGASRRAEKSRTL